MSATDNCIAPDIAFIVWTTGEQQQRNITGGINLNSLPNINAVLACGVRMDFSGKPRNATTGSHLLVRRTVHCFARSASHRRSKGRFGARQKPSSACATSSTGATGAACAADAAADPRRYLRAVGRRHRAQATAGRPTCSAPAHEVSKVWPLSIIQWARTQRAHRSMAPHLPSLSRWVGVEAAGNAPRRRRACPRRRCPR